MLGFHGYPLQHFDRTIIIAGQKPIFSGILVSGISAYRPITSSKVLNGSVRTSH